jgi:hypothetical protein
MWEDTSVRYNKTQQTTITPNIPVTSITSPTTAATAMQEMHPAGNITE